MVQIGFLALNAENYFLLALRFVVADLLGCTIRQGDQECLTTSLLIIYLRLNMYNTQITRRTETQLNGADKASPR